MKKKSKTIASEKGSSKKTVVETPEKDYVYDFSLKFVELLKRTSNEATNMRHFHTGTHHLLVALLEDEDCIGMQVLRNIMPKGYQPPTAEKAREEIRRIVRPDYKPQQRG